MRILVVAAAAWLAACYSPHYDDCLVRCLNNDHACPSGFACDGMYCRDGTSTQDCPAILGDAGLAGDSTNTSPDRDNDGKLNEVDNCPDKANADQYDEDGDGLGDVCDPCPPYGTAADNKDSDDDGVGDSCDPDPITEGNHILVFAGFNAGLEGGTALPSAQDWTTSAGTAVVNASLTATPRRLAWTLPPASGSEVVLTHAKVKAIGTSRPVGVGVFTQWDTSIPDGIVCTIGYESGTVGNLHLYQFSVNPTFGGLGNDSFGTNVTYSIDMTRRANTFKCGEPNAAGTPLTSGNVLRGPEVGLFVKALDVTFDWVLIVDGP